MEQIKKRIQELQMEIQRDKQRLNQVKQEADRVMSNIVGNTKAIEELQGILLATEPPKKPLKIAPKKKVLKKKK